MRGNKRGKNIRKVEMRRENKEERGEKEKIKGK